ncbi:MAG: helix-turn-helix domain-containing protein [Pseudomonadota bacterium]
MHSEIILVTREELAAIVGDAVRNELGAIVRESTLSTAALTEKEAAQYINQAPATLRTWRNQSRGPAYQKGARGIRYAKEDLDAWLKGNRVHTADSAKPNRRAAV